MQVINISDLMGPGWTPDMHYNPATEANLGDYVYGPKYMQATAPQGFKYILSGPLKGRLVRESFHVNGLDDVSTLTSTAPIWGLIAAASMAASAYHGYKRNNSVGWAIWWAFMGSLFPVITPVIAIAQGYGKPIEAAPAPAKA